MKHRAKPLISVILPVYNAETTLPDTLKSLIRQRFDSFEVIAVDDGSEDRSQSILTRFSGLDSRICPIFPGRQGLVKTLNTGLSQARGNFIARMDADDIAHPERLALQLSFLQENQQIAVVSSLIRCFPQPKVSKGFKIYESWLNSLCDPDEISREIFIESPLVHPSTLIRRSILQVAGGYKDFGWPEDYDLWLRFHITGKRFAKIPRLLTFWRESQNRLTRQDSRYSVENFLRAKAHYLRLGPLAVDPRAIIWGAGQIGRRLSKHLQREGINLVAFVDIDPKKIGKTRRGAPVISPEALLQTWKSTGKPLILSAVPSRGARDLIRKRLKILGLTEGNDFLCTA